MKLLTPEQAGKKGKSYFFEDGSPARFYDDVTRNVYALVPTVDWPTITISGIKMHEASPKRQVNKRMKLLRPTGKALDVCTGLGYSAIALSKKCSSVTTMEINENIIALAKLNPESQKLFSENKITRVIGDASQLIKNYSNEFKCACIDPPRYPLGSQLYSLEFFKDLKNALKKGARIYFYTGTPYSKHRKRAFVKGVGERLREAGFKGVKWDEGTRGFIAIN